MAREPVKHGAECNRVVNLWPALVEQLSGGS